MEPKNSPHYWADIWHGTGIISSADPGPWLMRFRSTQARDSFLDWLQVHSVVESNLRAQLTTSQARVTALESALRDVLAESAAPSNPCDASMYHAVCRAARAALDRK